MPFGAFVEIAPGIEGLVHVSEMSWVKRVHHPSDVVAPGQQVQVNILSIDEAKKTVSLSLKDTSTDPWRDAQARFAIGSDATGVVSKKVKFGYFIDLAEGITALLPLGNIAADKKDSVKEGATLTSRVESVDTGARRISLSLGMKEILEQTAEVKEYLSQQSTGPVKKQASQSTEFGAALLEAMKKNKK
jgi:small subunit ribosomal protein S1